MKCKLCKGTGKNTTGERMNVNNKICPRCGGYGTVPDGTDNPKSLTEEDREYINCNQRGESDGIRTQPHG
jgi:DnaJ-class molecular chaperone